MIKKIIFAIIPALLISCGNGNNKSDAYGNFEAIEVLVGSEAQGRVVNSTIEEGVSIKKNQIVGLIDTTSLYLKKLQLIAQIEASNARLVQIQSQVTVQEEQKKTLVREQARMGKLVESEAAPSKQLDDINGQISVLNSQILSIQTQGQAVQAEAKALSFQVAQINDQIQKSIIINPIDGTVLETYVEQGEVVVPGKVLYKIADMSELKLRVYISGDQLASVKIGQKVKVRIDKDKDNYTELDGTISWVSQQAEFTPKIIQTKEERVNMVYAVKVSVPNDGSLKVGMPGEIKF